MRKAESIIEIKEDVKIGNIILKKGDRIKVLEYSGDRNSLYGNEENDEVHTKLNTASSLISNHDYAELMNTAENQYDLYANIDSNGLIDFIGSIYDMEDFFNSVVEDSYEDYLV